MAGIYHPSLGQDMDNKVTQLGARSRSRNWKAGTSLGRTEVTNWLSMNSFTFPLSISVLWGKGKMPVSITLPWESAVFCSPSSRNECGLLQSWAYSGKGYNPPALPALDHRTSHHPWPWSQGSCHSQSRKVSASGSCPLFHFHQEMDCCHLEGCRYPCEHKNTRRQYN